MLDQRWEMLFYLLKNIDLNASAVSNYCKLREESLLGQVEWSKAPVLLCMRPINFRDVERVGRVIEGNRLEKIALNVPDPRILFLLWYLSETWQWLAL